MIIDFNYTCFLLSRSTSFSNRSVVLSICRVTFGHILFDTRAKSFLRFDSICMWGEHVDGIKSPALISCDSSKSSFVTFFEDISCVARRSTLLSYELHPYVRAHDLKDVRVGHFDRQNVRQKSPWWVWGPSCAQLRSSGWEHAWERMNQKRPATRDYERNNLTSEEMCYNDASWMKVRSYWIHYRYVSVYIWNCMNLFRGLISLRAISIIRHFWDFLFSSGCDSCKVLRTVIGISPF